MTQTKRAILERAQKSPARIVIIGAGLAGLFTALKLAPLPVLVISPTALGEGASSFWAQGGIAAAIGEGDLPSKHVADTIAAGAGLVDETVASLVAGEASDRIDDLLSFGVPFDKDLEGKLALSREAAHSARRIVRVKGDMAGQAIMAALISSVRVTDSIDVLEGYRVEKLNTLEGRVCGLTVSDFRGGESQARISASAVVLATGGIGGLYAVTTNPVTSSGEGLGMAARAGAVIADAEFVQFHPTAIHAQLDPAPLATEALRGEGAILVDDLGKRFMPDYHEDAELAPRDIVARAVYDQAQLNGAFLDCREAIGLTFADQYPTVYEKCRAAGIDPALSPIPVAPAVHYHMGGVWTDERGRSSIKGLWACGEVASTGMHGANRLASNSLLEAVVFAARIAEDLKSLELDTTAPPESPAYPAFWLTREKERSLTARLREAMTKGLGVVRNESYMEELLQFLDSQIEDERLSPALLNKLTAARFMVTAALGRKESRGGHFRSDYPKKDAKFKYRSRFKLNTEDNRIIIANEYT